MSTCVNVCQRVSTCVNVLLPSSNPYLFHKKQNTISDYLPLAKFALRLSVNVANSPISRKMTIKSNTFTRRQYTVKRATLYCETPAKRLHKKSFGRWLILPYYLRVHQDNNVVQTFDSLIRNNVYIFAKVCASSFNIFTLFDRNAWFLNQVFIFDS